MRDGAVRQFVKWLARTVKSFDLFFTRRLATPPRYRLLGSCNGCGKCCESPSIPVSRFTWHVPTARRVFLWWQRVVNGFELKAADPRFRVFVFHCTHVDVTTKQCDSYDSRPLMCRDYPKNLTFEAVPSLFPECSYVVQDKNADSLRDALINAGVTGEKLAEAEDKLFLRGEKK
ncbi:MAG: YkgJ family cysteine cluster protein [Archangium sp.]